MGVEVRHLAALAAIARTRSFSRAGEELGYAQSAVSQQLAMLERAVGHRLVERPGGPKPVSLTEAGELLLRHAEAITARLSAAKADLDALAAGEAGTLRVGTFQSAGARLLPPTLGRFRERWPLVDVKLQGDSNDEALDMMVLAGRLDLAFTDYDGIRAPLTGVPILTDPYVLLVPPGHALAGRKAADLAQLEGAAMIFSPEDDACARRVARAFRNVRSQPNIVFRTDDNLTIQRLVATGLGCAVMPALAVEDDVPGTGGVVVPLAGPDPLQRRIGLVWHGERYRTKAAQAFVEVAEEVGREEAERRRPWHRERPLGSGTRRRRAG